MLSKKKGTTNWKNIIVIDDAKNEIAHFELDEMARIKNKLNHPKKISAFMKQITVNNEIIKVNGIYHIVAKKPVLSFSRNVDIFSLPNDCDNKLEQIDCNYILNNKIKDDENTEIKNNTLIDELNQSNSLNYLDFEEKEYSSGNEFEDILDL